MARLRINNSMNPQFSTSILAIALLLGVAFATLDEEHNAVQFSYNGELNGPKLWGKLSPSFKACESGKLQSPVNIITNQALLNKTLEPLSMNYSSVADATIINLGSAIGVHFEGNVGDLWIDGKKYSLKQMHWHTPAEHQIDGKKYPAELHVVHVADDGNVAVVASIFNYGLQDPLIKEINQYLGKLAGSNTKGNKIPIGKLDTKYLRQNTLKYYRYKGSLTTPPCTETVLWSVLPELRSISKEQVEALRAPLALDCKSNARPLQPLGDRIMQFYDSGSNN